VNRLIFRIILFNIGRARYDKAAWGDKLVDSFQFSGFVAAAWPQPNLKLETSKLETSN
jgi:hypothetical protein